MLVTGIDARRPAAQDGFRVGDVLVRLGDQPVRRVADVERLLRSRAPSGAGLDAFLIRSRTTAVLTVSVSGSEADLLLVSPETRSRDELERALIHEIEGLHTRIRELREQIEALEE